MSKLRPVHLAILGAFLAGVLATIIVTLLVGSDNGKTYVVTLAPLTPTPGGTTPTPRPTATLEPTALPSTPIPAVPRVPAPPSLPAPPVLIAPTPLIGTPTALQQPGNCTNAAEPVYLARALPVLQQLGSAYQTWSKATIATTSDEMKSLRLFLMPFTQSFEAITPVPDGCTFIHTKVLQAAKDLSDTASRVDISNTEALMAGWDAEYNGRTGNMKDALDLYLSSTASTLTPRPFP